jgi:hypothetical protein
MAKSQPDPRVTKRRVAMINVRAIGVDEKGRPLTLTEQAEDYVRPDLLDAYVADARTRWQTVTVDPEPDAGPGGYHGQTHVPGPVADTDVADDGTLTGLPGLAHPLAGQTFPATKED